MSGGHFDYENDRLCENIYGYSVFPNYGEKGFAQSKKARRINPLEDLVISELVFDVFCLLHSYDWYKSGDTCEETYRDDVKRFKKKWLTSLSQSHIKEVVNDEIFRLRDELYKAFDIEETEENERLRAENEQYRKAAEKSVKRMHDKMMVECEEKIDKIKAELEGK